MRPFYVHISGFIGILTFAKHLWAHASVERTVFVSLAVGLGIFFVLSVGDAVIQHILNKPAPKEPEDAKVKDETVTSNTSNASIPKTA